MKLIAIDPGLRACGVAVFDGATKELKAAALVRNAHKGRFPAAWVAMAEAVFLLFGAAPSDALVIEVPQVYRFSKGDPGDLIELAGVVGAVSARLAPVSVHGYLPRTWKGTTPKDIHNARVRARLTEAERTRLPDLPKSLIHNVIDAVGLGLFHLGRGA